MSDEIERTLDTSTDETVATPPTPPSVRDHPDAVSHHEVDYTAAWRTVRGWVNEAAVGTGVLDAGKLGVLMDQLENPPVSDPKVDLGT